MKSKIIAVAIVVSLFGVSSLAAREYKVVVPQLSPQATEVYKQLAIAIIEATGNTVSVQVAPFARCIYLLESGQADFESMIVQIPDQSKWDSLKADYSTASSVKIAFVLYTNKNKPINLSELKKGNPKGYKIETDSAHVNYFGFMVDPSASIEGSLKKLQAGTIDGYIFSQGSTDAVLKKLGFKDIVRQSYDNLNGVFLLAKGGRGGELDKLITEGLAKIKANKKFQEIVGKYMTTASTYIDWQP